MYSSSGSTLFRWPVVPPTVIRVGSLRSKASSLATAVDYWSRQPGAAYSAGLRTEAGQLLVRLEEVAEPTDLDLAVLRAHAACADRKVEAVQLGQLAPGIDPETAFGFPVLIGHHANWAAHGYSPAVWELRQGQSASGSIAEADQLVRHTPLWHHMLRTIIAPVVYQAGVVAAAEAWLREADAFCSAAGERALQRRVRHTRASIGAKVP
jgi:hypothetical protein